MFRRLWRSFWEDQPTEYVDDVPERFDDPHAAMVDLSRRVRMIQRVQLSNQVMLALIGLVLLVIAAAAWNGGFSVSVGREPHQERYSRQ